MNFRWWPSKLKEGLTLSGVTGMCLPSEWLPVFLDTEDLPLRLPCHSPLLRYPQVNCSDLVKPAEKRSSLMALADRIKTPQEDFLFVDIWLRVVSKSTLTLNKWLMGEATGLRKSWMVGKANPFQSEHGLSLRKWRTCVETTEGRPDWWDSLQFSCQLFVLLLVYKEEQSATESTVPLKKGFPFVISFVAKPGPLGQSSSYSGVFLTGHSSHSSVPQAAPTEQQQASMRWRPATGRVHSSSSYLRKQVSRRISARWNTGRLRRATLFPLPQTADQLGQARYNVHNLLCTYWLE